MTGEPSPAPADPVKAALKNALVYADDALSEVGDAPTVRRNIADAISCLITALNLHEQAPSWKSAAEVDAALRDS